MTATQVQPDDEDSHAHYRDQLAEAEDLIADLQVALTNARRIGAAVGILMTQHKITYDAAFEQLSAVSQNRNRKLRDVAEEVVLTGAL